jgi:YD repeat-containing protein
MITQDVYTTNDSTYIETQFNYDETTEKLTSVVVDYGGGGHLNLTTAYGYDSVGNCNSLTDPNGNETTFVSNSERLRTQMTAPSPFSYLTNLGYDANSNLTSIARQLTSVPVYQTTSLAYTVTNKLYTITDPLLLVTTNAYDGADRLESVVDAQNRQWQYAYDQLNRIYTVTDPTNTICDTRAYTDNGYLETREDANTNVTQFAYDGLDRLSITTFADMTTQENSSYDANGNVLTYLPRYGADYPTTMTYDALNRLATKSPYDQAEITCTYDLSSRLTELNKAGSGDPSCGNFQRFYDTAGRFYEETFPNTPDALRSRSLLRLIAPEV